MIRSLLAAAVTAAALVTPVATTADAKCRTKACDKRVARKHARLREHGYPMCNTWACAGRVKRARARRQVERWRAEARPYLGILAAIRGCETRGRAAPYTTATGNGFLGAYQFTPQTWYAYGGRSWPSSASKAEQDAIASRLYRAHGVHSSASWPNCP